VVCLIGNCCNITFSKSFTKVFLALIGFTFLLILYFLVWDYPKIQVIQNPSIEKKDELTVEDKVRSTWINAIGGLFFFVTAYFAWKNSDISHKQLLATQEKQITERFSKAVEQLGEESITVRLGAIYSLERIAKDSKYDHWTIMEVLTAFIREKSNRENENLTLLLENEVLRHFAENFMYQGVSTLDVSKIIEGTYSYYNDKVPQDVQASLTVIGRRNIENDNESEEKRLDLSKTNLNNTELYRANLDNADLIGGKLNGAGLIKAKLNNALLYGTEFNQALLNYAELNGAKLNGAELNDAKMRATKLKKAELNTAKLYKAFLQEADFTDAYLTATILIEADFRGANLTRADLSDADIEAANFKDSQTQKTQITVEQILKAKNWDKAHYNSDFWEQLKPYLTTQNE
jgi:uncharacterized protein YjbI with pentapeptide repeats